MKKKRYKPQGFSAKFKAETQKVNKITLLLILAITESLCPLFFIKFLFFHQMIGLQKL